MMDDDLNIRGLAAKQVAAQVEGFELELWRKHYAGYNSERILALIQARRGDEWLIERDTPEFSALRGLWRHQNPDVARTLPVIDVLAIEQSVDWWSKPRDEP